MSFSFAPNLLSLTIMLGFDFDGFLTSTLINDVQQTGQGYKVLRRRIAILIGQWITIKVSDSNRPLVYQLFQHLLNKDDETNDHVVRVTAARYVIILKVVIGKVHRSLTSFRQFKVIVDDFGFVPEGFLPYAQNTLDLIIGLLQVSILLCCAQTQVQKNRNGSQLPQVMLYDL